MNALRYAYDDLALVAPTRVGCCRPRQIISSPEMPELYLKSFKARRKTSLQSPPVQFNADISYLRQPRRRVAEDFEFTSFDIDFQQVDGICVGES